MEAKKSNPVAKKVATVNLTPLTREQVEQKVREAAYYKWQAAGRPHGRDVEFWNAAEVEVHRED